MTRSIGAALFLFGLSCGGGAAAVGGQGAGSGSGSTGGEGDGAGNPPPPPITTCPATLAEAVTVGACTIGTSPNCQYDNGWCGCGGHANCGGAPMPDPVPGTPGVWGCNSSDPGITRADGCPLSAPPDASACGAARSCDYTVCSWNSTTAHCDGGHWRVVHRMLAPPP